jgi:uncharacterized protein (DUF4415 family)
VLRGFSTAGIGAKLAISDLTVQHLKAVFDKVGVGSRRELVAQIFAQQYRPRLRRHFNTRVAQNDPDNPPLRTGAKLRPLRQVLPELAARGPGRPPIANPKVQVTLRLDQDLLAAIRASGGGWQTRVNQTLRKTFVRARKRRTGS